MKAFLLAIPFCLAASLAAQDKATPAKVPEPGATVAAAPAPAGDEHAKHKPRVQFTTSYGPFVVELEPELAPETVANFLLYVSEGHYVDTLFHRVIQGFMIQGGGLVFDMSEKPTHKPIRNEAPLTAKAGLLNTRGTLAMARQDDPQSATAQFYINTADNPSLDFKGLSDATMGYCVFGHVVSGMDTVDKIEKVRTGWKHGLQNVPEYPLRIKAAVRLPEAP